MHNLPAPRHNRQLARQQDVQYVAHPEPVRGREPGLREYIDILRRRKWLVFTPLAIVLPLMALHLALKPAVYEATTTLLIERVEPKLLAIQGVVTADQTEDFYHTQYELMQSRAVAEQVVDSLDLHEHLPPEDASLMQRLEAMQRWAARMARAAARRVQNAFGVDTASQARLKPKQAGLSRREQAIVQLQQTLKVKPREGTRLVDISLSGTSPTEVTRQVNTVAEVYVKQNMERKREASKKAVAQLKEEANHLKQKLRQNKDTLRELKQQQQMVSTNTDDGTKKLEHLEESYLQTSKERKKLEMRIQELQEVSKNTRKDSLKKSLTFLLPGELREASSLPDLLKTYSKLQSNHANLARKFGAKHPSIVEMTSEIEDVNRAIDEEVERIIKGFQAEYRVLLAQEQKIEGDLQAQKQDMITLDSHGADYYELQRELDIDKKLYETVSHRLAEASLADSVEMNNIKIVQPAARGTVRSGKMQTVLLSLMVAFGLGVGWAVAAEFLDTRFKSVDEIEGYLGIPFLGVIPHYRAEREKPVVLYAPESSAAEAYRTVRTWIQMTSDPAVRTLLVTSAVAGEGKSTTAANLALSFAQLGRRVVLIDADLRRPMAHQIFNLDNRQGLTDILEGNAVWQAVLQDSSMENLKIVPTGGTPHNPTELLSTTRMHTLLENLKTVFDLVIVDSPVVLSITDVAILAPQVDWTLLVHYPSRADRDTVMEAKRLLDRASANLLGIVFNNIHQSEHTYYHTVPDGGYRTEKPVRPRQPDASFVDMRPNETQGTWVIDAPPAPPSPDDHAQTPRRNDG